MIEFCTEYLKLPQRKRDEFIERVKECLDQEEYEALVTCLKSIEFMSNEPKYKAIKEQLAYELYEHFTKEN